MNKNTAAARIRANLKTAGIPAKAVSVRTRSTGSVDVVVNSLDVDFKKVKEIAQQEERVSRCEATGEILSGGNTFVFVSLGDVAVDVAMAEVKPVDGSMGLVHLFRGVEIYSESNGDYVAYSVDPESLFTRQIARTYSLRNAVASVVCRA